MVEIVLTFEENELFECLMRSIYFNTIKEDEFLNAYTHTDSSNETVIRIAGGWVRDKLLGLNSSDIDIALNNQSGLAFAEAVNAYLQSLGKETRTIGIIQANPDQSKHLQTANIKVLGYDIDCVNLRAETYADESRIPVTTIGSPIEDATRRDFTINSLFYNLKTRHIEDFTTKGIADLQQGLIRTPISASTTFRDDPLRIFRAIRFASRFYFALDDELQDAVRRPDIHAAVLSKVSRERVYKECDGCFSDSSSGMPARPYMAIFLMCRLNILDAVLPLQHIIRSFPIIDCAMRSELNVTQSWMNTALSGVFWLDLLWAVRAHLLPDRWTDFGVMTFFEKSRFTVSAELLRSPRRGEHLKPLVWAAVCAGMAGLHVSEKKKSVSLIPVALREGLKMEALTIKQVQIALDSAATFGIFLDKMPHGMRGDDGAWVDEDVEKIGLQLLSCREMWKDCLLFACAMKLKDIDPGGSAPSTSVGGEHVNKEMIFKDVNLLQKSVRTILACVRLQQEVEDLQLDRVWSAKPHFDGLELMRSLSISKGPLVGKAMELQTRWQIRNARRKGDASLRSDCLNYIRIHLDLLA